MICGGPDPDPVCLEEAPTLPGTTSFLPFLLSSLSRKKGGVEATKNKILKSKNKKESNLLDGIQKGWTSSRSDSKIAPRV